MVRYRWVGMDLKCLTALVVVLSIQARVAVAKDLHLPTADDNSHLYESTTFVYNGPVAKRIIPLVVSVTRESQNIGQNSVACIAGDDFRNLLHESNWSNVEEGHVNYANRGQGPLGSVGVDSSISHDLVDCRYYTENLKCGENKNEVNGTGALKRVSIHKPKKCIPVPHLRHILYTATVGVGTPRQIFKPIFDTGSTNTWVVGSKCESGGCKLVNKFDPQRSSTFCFWNEAQGSIDANNSSGEGMAERMQVRFGTGSIIGTTATETFQIGDVSVASQVFGLVTQEIPDENDEHGDIFQRIKFEGIIGLGMPEMAWKKHKSLFDSYTDKLGVAKTFGFYFSKGQYSAVTVGGVDHRMYHGEIKMMPVVRDMYWEVKLHQVWIGGEKICCEKGPAFAIFDTGTSFNTLPHDAFMRFKQIVTIKPLQEGTKDANLADYPVIKYVFGGGLVAEIHPHQYLFVSKEQLKPAYMQINVPSSDGDAYILGNAAFMQHYYTVFKRMDGTSPAMIGFAPSAQDEDGELQRALQALAKERRL